MSGRRAGVCRADSGPCPSAIGDEGDAGERLEVYCSELPPSARDDKCLTDDSVLTDVPAGVPALAGHLVRVTGAATEEAVVERFDVSPGPVTCLRGKPGVLAAGFSAVA